MLRLLADYVVQGSRFQVLEEFGCASAPIGSGVEILLQQVWYVGMPLISIVLYLRERFHMLCIQIIADTV